MKYRVDEQEESLTLGAGDFFMHPLAQNMSLTQ